MDTKSNQPNLCNRLQDIEEYAKYLPIYKVSALVADALEGEYGASVSDLAAKLRSRNDAKKQA